MVASGRRTKTPIWFWIASVAALMWNAFGAFDYLMTRTRNVDYLSQMPGLTAQDILTYIDGLPIYAQFGWGLGVWGGLLGSLLLVTRSRFAVHAFAASLIGAAVSFGHQYLGGAQMPPAMEQGAHKYMPLFIILVAIGLLLFARAMLKRGVLR